MKCMIITLRMQVICLVWNNVLGVLVALNHTSEVLKSPYVSISHA